jgi:hypothetical protein
MRIELVSQSKYRSGSKVGDDVPLIVPGQVYGVFDGATDPRGTMVEGIGAGRLAALTVARDMADLASKPEIRRLPGEEIVRRLSDGLIRRTGPLDLPVPPSTTLAVALDCGEVWRFVLLGDSSIRLNGREILRREKLIDKVSTAARVAVFNLLHERLDDLDLVEKSTRRAIFLGLDLAVKEGVMDRSSADGAVARAIAETGLQNSAAAVAAFLGGGLQTQFRFGNATGSPLCFDTLNGTTPKLGHIIDVERPKSDIFSIEIFSDGYPDLPRDMTAAAWETSFHEAERVDFHKTGPFATVKGSTSDEFFDDRTVLILSGI